MVLIGGMPAARLGDMATCVGPPDSIIKGAFPVPIANNPAARMSDQTAHGGVIALGCPTVLIGLSGTTGNPRVGGAQCQAAAAGRTSGSTAQSYNNCGVESSRQIINQANGSARTENGLLQQAINSGNASGTAGSPPVFADGGTTQSGRQAILQSSGVNSTSEASTLENIGLASSRGQGVIATIDAAPLWNATAAVGVPLTVPPALHAVTVTGVKYDDAGNVTDVIINDTGTGKCGQVVPVAVWNKATAAFPGGGELNVTTTPIW